MKKTTVYHIFKVFCFIVLACFLLSACGNKNNAPGALADAQCGPGEECREAISQNTCWQRSILEVMYNDLGGMTTKVYKTITQEHPGTIMVTIFVIWMAWQILKHVASPSGEDIGEFWTNIIRKAALCLVCGLLVSDTSNILYAVNTFVLPIYVTFLEYTSELLKILGNDPTARATSFTFTMQEGLLRSNGTDAESARQICTAYVHHINDGKCTVVDPKAIFMTADSFPKGPLDMLSCITCAISDRLSMGYSIAMNLFLPPNVTSTITALFLVVVFTIAKIGFALYMIDSIFRLDMIIIVIPFLIMFYPFEKTRKWTIEGFKIIISSSAIMMCIGTVIAMTVFAMQALLTNPNLGFSWFDFDSYKNFGVVPMALIMMGFMVVKATQTGMDIANKITGYDNDPSTQKRLQKLVATVGRAIAGFVLMVATAGLSEVARISNKYGGRMAAAAAKYTEGKGKIKDNFSKGMDKLNKLAGRK